MVPTVVLGLIKSLNVGKIFQLMGSQWKLVLIFVLASLLLYQNKWDGPEFLLGIDTIPNKIEQLEKMDRVLKKTEARNQTLVDVLDQINQQVDKWKETTALLEQKQTELKKQVDVFKKQNKEAVNKILTEETPKNCEDAIKYLKEGIKDLAW